jgi:BolA family transcriptional regulator, general stress-responsive regulator
MRHEEPFASDDKSAVTSVKDRMRTKLEAAFAPTLLEIEDQSHLHAGHAGSRAGGQTHFLVKVASASFVGKGRVERHRMIYASLADEIAQGVHALAIDARTPGEA